MIVSMNLSQLAADCNGKLSGDAQFSRVCTDSRGLRAGDLFIALTGEHFDGNQFVSQAVDKGAVAVVVNRQPDVDIPFLLVDDPRFVLGLIARNNRRQFTGPVIGLTGSTGKTTCKDMLAAILGECGEVLATQGNFNNEIGVPLTLLRIGTQHHAAVIEMGASRAGDIRYLCQFAEPVIGLVTNAMPAHLQGFGSLETIAATKGEIFSGISDGGVAIINLDDAFSPQWQQLAGNKQVVTFAINNKNANVCARDIQVSTSAKLTFVLTADETEVPIHLSVLGRHNVANALAASAAAIAAGANLQQVQLGLEKIRPVKGRLMPMKTNDDKVVIDDTYNASPGSVKAAIDVLADCANARTQVSTCLVLGTMAELGGQTIPLHEEVAVYAREQGVDNLIAVGQYAQQVINAFGKGAVAFEQVDTLLAELDKYINADIVLVKGSRSAHMETVVSKLMSDTDVVNNILGGH